VGVEIERKFLVLGEPWRAWPGTRLVQAYLAVQDGRTVRVRVAGDVGTLTIKGPSRGATRAEFELPVPVAMIEAMVAALDPPGRVEKTRYEIPVGQHVFEVDVFEGANAGLVVAEVELSAEDEAFERPTWLGTEVTDDLRYTNSQLSVVPWTTWGRP
jgi:adenylate cyclase